jgi:Tfp pilus assembly protein PilN
VIKINLLPPELQRAASLPKLVFYTLSASVVSVMLVGIAGVWIWIDTGNMKNNLENRRAEVASIEAQASQLDRINEDIAYYKEREKAIIQIKTRRILWGPKLDQLVALTPDDIWITRFEMDTLDPGEYRWEAGKRQNGGQLNLTCYSEGTDPSSFTRFRSSLSEDKRLFAGMIDISALPDHFFGDFLGFSPHAWSLVEGKDGGEDRLQSTIQIDLKPLYESPKDPAAGAKGKG